MSPRKPTLLFLLVIVSPLLLSVSCLETTTPDFTSAAGVVRGAWYGSIADPGDGEQVAEFRLDNVDAVRTGPDAYRFAGDVWFGRDDASSARITGTGTVDPPFAPSPRARLSPQMQPPPGPTYTLRATVVLPDGTVAWRLEGENGTRTVDQRGTAVDAEGTAYRFSIAPLGQRVHVMALGTEPRTLPRGQPFDVVWSGWAPEGVRTWCRVRSTSDPSEHDVQEDCMSGPQRMTLHLAEGTGPVTRPTVVVVSLDYAWGEDLEHERSLHMEVPLVVEGGP